MTSFLTHEGGIAAGLTVNFAQKNGRGSFPARPSSMSPRTYLRGQAHLGPLRQLMRRIHKSVVGGDADIAPDIAVCGLMTYIRYQP